MVKKMMKHRIYIPSRGRADNCITARILEAEGLNYVIVIEPQEEKLYKSFYPYVVMDKNNMGISYVRNWIKKYSISKEEKYHWQIDDNIKSFRVRKYGKNEKSNAAYCLRRAENFVDRYSNVGIAGLTHTAFAFSRKTDIGLNKQVYSCILVNNSVDVWWRTNTVEDTDYSLQVLMTENNKYCTILFHRLLIEKAPTMKMKGGNTEISYSGKGRMVRSLGLIDQYPGWFKMTEQYGRPKILPSRIWSRFTQKPI